MTQCPPRCRAPRGGSGVIALPSCRPRNVHPRRSFPFGVRNVRVKFKGRRPDVEKKKQRRCESAGEQVPMCRCCDSRAEVCASMSCVKGAHTRERAIMSEGGNNKR